MDGPVHPAKTNAGRFFEDYEVGQVIRHAVPRTVGAGERALYHALYPARHALHSSDAFAQACGLGAAPLDDLLAFHVVFGKTVPDISLNAVANLGYAEGRFLADIYPGDTLRAVSEVIGRKENSNGKTGVVWVRTRGLDQNDAVVIEYVRWVMVKKRSEGGKTLSDIDGLDPKARVEEIARMLAGADITPEARAAARRLLEDTCPAKPRPRL